MSFSPAQKPGGNASHNSEWRHVFSHYRAGPDYASLSDCYAGQDYGVYADVGPGLDLDLFDFKVCLDDRDLNWRPDVGRTQDFSPRPPTDVLLHNQVTGVEIGLRADPYVIADDTAAVDPSLYIGLGANENPVADFEGLHVFKTDAAANAKPVSDPSRQRAPYRSPHQRVEVAVPQRKARVQFEQPCAVVLAAQVLCQFDLEFRVRRHFPQSVDGFNQGMSLEAFDARFKFFSHKVLRAQRFSERRHDVILFSLGHLRIKRQKQ